MLGGGRRDGSVPPMSSPFVRDRLTVLLYACMVAFGLAIAALGPAVPSLRGDLGVSRTVAGLHFTALALGSVVVGLIGSRMARRLGRRRVLQWGLLGLAVGPMGLVLGPTPSWTVTASFVFGFAGNLVLLVVSAALADHHGERRSTALAEANTVAGLVFMVPGFLIGGLVASGLSWRLAFAAPVVVALLLLRPVTGTALPVAAPPTGDGDGRFLPGFRAAIVALATAVAIEWSIAGWAAEHLVDVGAPIALAAVGTSAFYGSVSVGRIVGIPLTRRVAEGPLLVWSLALIALGVPVFWLGPTPAWVLVGVVISGLGVGNQFPLLASVMFARAPGLTDAASARISLVGGLAIVVAPITLGAWADARGLHEALSGVVLLVVALAIALFGALRGASAPAGRLPA